MRLHHKGYIPLLVMLALLLCMVWLINLVFPVQSTIHYILYCAGVIFYFLCIRFFRRPYREVLPDPEQILSAADGHVVVIEEIQETEYFHDRRMQVSIFMSPLDVHVNWYPVSGEIIHTKYHHGSHIPAYRPKASMKNERMSIVIENEHGKPVMMTQIAGIMARRVFTTARPGSYVFQGEEAGIIKFGSRVDIILPKDSEIVVKLGQKVSACKTIIARFPDKNLFLQKS
ncbi:MAG: phosphatidylserine decarboxylase family protein [Bacteroidales bacterium]|nr:phosphatidylserine decarboxylase family protein [Bacteroidales bacterium]